ncbi:MFS transporter [Plebeiibacterium sediminum]|uniref:MFS transporter n=1 Tax=Plebeiibacterium sediminum TaxID=2992112 RepID=A0AAE3SDM4_9BACT|nr:MFS transporter [Plebeiobacterium sediminum]MCW3785578.1 MFS transporter [Plebeiobacterium sediminum]
MITSDKISVKEKIGYSLGDLAANLIFQTIVTFLAFFYTDVYKINPGTASRIIFVGGMVGAFFNPVMGIIADRTNTKWGKFRPWILWTAIPLGIMSILAFSTPDFSLQGKLAYAFTTYTLLVIAYSANNVPYSALSGVITGEMVQRNSVFSYRFLAVMVAQFIVQTLLLPLSLILGDGDKTRGFENAIGILAVIGIMLFVISFYATKERVETNAAQKSSVKIDFTDLANNKPGIILFMVTIFVFITLTLKSGMHVYYFKHYLSEPHLAKFLNDIGFNSYVEALNAFFKSLGLIGFQWPENPSESAFGLFNAEGIILMIIGIITSKSLANQYGKRIVFSAGLILSAFTLSVFVFYQPDSIGMVFFTQMLHGFSYGITIPLLWSMIADVVDFSEWKNYRRATAFNFSVMIFGLKVGLSIGGALVAAILARYGYQEQLVMQNAETIAGIKMSVSVYPAITFILAFICLLFYEIDKNKELVIEKELKERRIKTS